MKFICGSILIIQLVSSPCLAKYCQRYINVILGGAEIVKTVSLQSFDEHGVVLVKDSPDFLWTSLSAPRFGATQGDPRWMVIYLDRSGIDPNSAHFVYTVNSNTVKVPRPHRFNQFLTEQNSIWRFVEEGDVSAKRFLELFLENKTPIDLPDGMIFIHDASFHYGIISIPIHYLQRYQILARVLLKLAPEIENENVAYATLLMEKLASIIDARTANIFMKIIYAQSEETISVLEQYVDEVLWANRSLYQVLLELLEEVALQFPPYSFSPHMLNKLKLSIRRYVSSSNVDFWDPNYFTRQSYDQILKSQLQFR